MQEYTRAQCDALSDLVDGANHLDVLMHFDRCMFVCFVLVVVAIIFSRKGSA